MGCKDCSYIYRKNGRLNITGTVSKIKYVVFASYGATQSMLHLIETKDIEFQDNFKVCVIRTNHVLKQTRPGYHLQDIVLHSYNNEKLCVVETLREYLRRTEG